MSLVCLMLSLTTSCRTLDVAGLIVDLGVAYVANDLRDSVVVYKCPLWLENERWQLTESQKATTERPIKEKMVAFNRKVEAFCVENER